MKTVVVLSFDLISPDEPSVSLSIASLLAYVKMHSSADEALRIRHLSFNLVERPLLSTDDVMNVLMREIALSDVGIIAMSCYVWSEFLINPLISDLRREGYSGRVVLGGYQIEYSESLNVEYPDCQVFVKGYGEESLLRIVSQELSTPAVLNEEPEFVSIPSPYIAGVIPVRPGQGRVRAESKRGCPYRCSFCAHRDLQRNKVYRHSRDRIVEELRLFNARGVRKVNMVDPVFNAGPDYLWVLERLAETGAEYLISLQSRFENIRSAPGDRFLDLCSALNVCLEFGLQSTVEEECRAINRRNDIGAIDGILDELNRREIQYAVSLIYGLPRQTRKSFETSISYLRSRDCRVIKAYPLMLLKGTELWSQKSLWGFREEVSGPYRIPVVVESNSFSEEEWREMEAIAMELPAPDRY